MWNDSWILANLSTIRRHSSQDAKKEIAVNLLEDLLTLYIRVRSHSFVVVKVLAPWETGHAPFNSSWLSPIKMPNFSLNGKRGGGGGILKFTL